MKLKEFDEVNVATICNYSVFSRDGEVLDYFECNYLNGKGILKKLDLIEKGAEVRHVSYNFVQPALEVSVTI